jgi:lipopolysaccharide exporter
MDKKTLVKGGFWIAFSTFSKRFFALLSNLILARLLLPEDFGIISLAYVFWSFITLFTQNSTGLFIIYKGTSDPRYLNTTYTISIILGSIFAVALSLASPLIAGFLNEPDLSGLLVAYAFNLLLSSVYYVYEGILVRRMQYLELSKVTLLASVARLVLTALAALSGLRYWSFAVGDFSFWVVAYFLARNYSEIRLRLQIVPEVRDEVLSYCLGAVGSSFGFYANLNLDNFVVGKVLGSTSLGFYSLGYQLTTALSKVINPVINQLGTPFFAQLPDEEQQKQSLLTVVEQTAFLVAPLHGLLYLVLDRSFISLIFGEQWISVADVIPGLLICSFFRVVNNPLKSMLSAKGRPDINAKVNLYISPVAVMAFILGARYGGIVGVSIAVAVVLGIVWTVYWWWTACRIFRWSLLDFSWVCFKPLAITAVALLLSFSLVIGVKQLVFIAVYLLCFRLFAPKQFKNYVLIIGQIWKKLTRSNQSSPEP